MKLKQHIIRSTCRKEKKAIKNYPCRKTKRGRYIIAVMNSYYDEGTIGIGYHNGMEILQYIKGYTHPKGYFYENLINEKIPWRLNENICEELCENDQITEEQENNNRNGLFTFDFCL